MKWLVETEMDKKLKKTILLKREEHEDDRTRPNRSSILNDKDSKAAVIVTQT